MVNATEPKQIASRTGISIGILERWARTNYGERIACIYRRFKYRNLKNQLIDLINQKKSAAEMAEITEYHRNEIYRMCKEFGLKINNSKTLRYNNYDKILCEKFPSMFDKGYNMNKMAEESGISVTQICKWIWQHYGYGLRTLRKRTQKKVDVRLSPKNVRREKQLIQYLVDEKLSVT